MSISIQISRFISNLNKMENDENIMKNFILSNLKGRYYGVYLSDIEQKFLDNLYRAINVENIKNIETLKELSSYNISSSNISDILLYILGGGIKYRYDKENTYIERKKVLFIDYVTKIYDKINSRLLYPRTLYHIDYKYIPNKDINFFIDYINLHGHRSLDKLYNI